MKLLTIFADGGSRGNPGPAAGGAVLYDEGGSVVHEVGVFIGRATNNVAEWRGLVEGVRAARDLGANAVRIRLDSELVVKQLRGEYRVRHADLIPLHAEAKQILRGFTEIEIAHVPRKQNAAADALVNRVLDAKESIGV